MENIPGSAVIGSGYNIGEGRDLHPYRCTFSDANGLGFKHVPSRGESPGAVFELSMSHDEFMQGLAEHRITEHSPLIWVSNEKRGFWYALNARLQQIKTKYHPG